MTNSTTALVVPAPTQEDRAYDLAAEYHWTNRCEHVSYPLLSAAIRRALAAEAAAVELTKEKLALVERMRAAREVLVRRVDQGKADAEVGRLRILLRQVMEQHGEPCNLDRYGWCREHDTAPPCLYARIRVALDLPPPAQKGAPR